MKSVSMATDSTKIMFCSIRDSNSCPRKKNNLSHDSSALIGNGWVQLMTQAASEDIGANQLMTQSEN